MILTHGANSLERGGDFVEIGGRKYKTVLMPDNKVWLAENLDYQFVSVTTNPGSANAAAMCYYNNQPQTYGKEGTYKCGAFYNRGAMEYLESHPELLPDGWRIPFAEEYDTLMNSLVFDSVRDTTGQTLRAANGSVTQNFPSNWGGNNRSGFNAFPTGECAPDSENFGTRTTFLKSRKYKNGIVDNFSGRFRMTNDSMFTENTWNLYSQTWFYSLRLVRDNT